MKGARRQRGHRETMWSLPGCSQGRRRVGAAWTSVSPATASPTLALSNAADASCVQTESVACVWGWTAHQREDWPNIKYMHAWAHALKPSADSAPASGSGELESPPPAECVRSSTTCASLILSSSCGTTTHNWAGWASARDCWATAGRGRAHHLGKEEEGHYLAHVLIEKHAGDLPDASRRIHRLQRAGAVGISLCRAGGPG